MPQPNANLLAPSLFDLAAERGPAPALCDHTGERSFSEVAAEVGALAEELRRRLDGSHRSGIPVVAVIGEHDANTAVAILSVNMAGAAYLPIDREWPRTRADQILDAAAPALVLDSDSHDMMRSRVETPTSLPAHAAYVMFTSGTTGRPKGAVNTATGVLNTVRSVAEKWGIGAGDTILALSSFTFDLSAFDLFGGLAQGATLILPSRRERRSPDSLLELMVSRSATVWNGVPTGLDLAITAAEIEGVSLESLRVALVSGDWIAPSLARRTLTAAPGVRFVSLGGNTESSIWSVYREVDAVDPEWSSIPYGRALPGQMATVLRFGTLDPCAVHEKGEICFGGSGVGLGYLKAPELTAAAFEVNDIGQPVMYRTGDVGRLSASGEIELLGRADHRIKLGGYRIDPLEIESVLTRSPCVRRAIVTRRGNRFESGYLVAHVERGEEWSQESVRSFVEKRLPSYMVPAQYCLHHRLPLGANGKIDRRATQDEHSGDKE